MKRRKILTVFYYGDIGSQHLYKDVGSIPLGLAKCLNWDSTFAYVNINGMLSDVFYEHFVNLIPIKYTGNAFEAVIKFLWMSAKNYDVVSFYHFTRKHLLFVVIAKLRNPHIKVYIKADMGRNDIHRITKRTKAYWLAVKFLRKALPWPDLCTVETKAYVKQLNQTPLYKERIRYLPNGFWRDKDIPKNLECQKEKIILTVGRLGTSQKNTELLLNSFTAIPAAQRTGWNLVLVGTYTPEIFQEAQKLIAQDRTLQNRIKFTGNISEKKILNQYYSKAIIFCLPSRWEGAPLVLPEAIHHGCFPVVTDCCDALYDMLDQGRRGDIVPNEDTLALTKALERAMVDKTATVKRGMAAKQYVDQHFDWEKIIYRLQEYLNDVDREK